MPQIIGNLTSVTGFNELGLGKLGQGVRVVDLVKGLRQKIGLGTLTQALATRARAGVDRGVYMWLGELAIDVMLPSGHSETAEANFAEHALFGAKPRLQHVGDALRTHELTIRLHESFGNVQAAVNTLEALLAGHVPQPMVLANGKFVGYVVLKGFDKQWLERRMGHPTHATATLRFVEYWPTPDELKKLAKPKVLPAVKKKPNDQIPGLTKVEAMLRDPSKTVLRAGQGVGL